VKAWEITTVPPSSLVGLSDVHSPVLGCFLASTVSQHSSTAALVAASAFHLPSSAFVGESRVEGRASRVESRKERLAVSRWLLAKSAESLFWLIANG
jgi:hypothetical protein